MPKINTIPPEVLDVLKRSTITADRVILPPGQLPTPLYRAVNSALEHAGGTWNKKANAHLFTSDPRERLGLVVATGAQAVDLTIAAPKLKACAHKKATQAFYTPFVLAARVVEIAQVSGKDVLEPSCGAGALIRECITMGARFVTGFDIDLDAVFAIDREFPINKAQAHREDFLTVKPAEIYPRIVMNPPFTRGTDIAHVLHATRFLAPGGRLVAIMYPGSSAKPKFLNGLAPGCQFSMRQHVEAGTFKDSGTSIATEIVVIDRE